MKQFLSKLENKKNLSFDESKAAFEILMEGKASDDEIFDFLTLLSSKGEVSEEIAGGVYVLRNKSKRVKVKDNGDCLFASLLMTLDNGENDEPSKDAVMEFRGKIVDYITGNVKKKRYLSGEFPEMQEENTFWTVHGNEILSTPRAGQISGTGPSHLMYKDMDAYKTEMLLPKANKLNPSRHIQSHQ